jgi:hypothetical protein
MLGIDFHHTIFIIIFEKCFDMQKDYCCMRFVFCYPFCCSFCTWSGISCSTYQSLEKIASTKKVHTHTKQLMSKF